MSYFARVFSKTARPAPFGELVAAFGSFDVSPKVELVDGTEESWNELLVRDAIGRKICLIQRNQPGDGLFDEELDEFLDRLAECRPKRGAGWVKEYLGQVTTIYAAQYLHAASDQPDGCPSPADLLWKIKQIVGGIVQADGEGFSNERGYTVVWQFSANAAGPWAVAVLDEDGNWQTGKIELDNETHRSAFLAGLLPK